MPYVVRKVEATPNPNAIKLVLDKQISPEPLSFRSAASASGNGLATRLFAIPGIVSVFMLNDFVTINKSPEARWADIRAKAKRTVAKE